MTERHTLAPGKAMKALAGVMALAILVRVVWFALVDTQPVSDFFWYFNRATEIAQGLGYQVDGVKTAYWPVGYPAALGGWFAIVGPSVEAGKALNLLLAAATVPIVFYLGSLLFRSELTGILGALIYALFPPLIGYTGILASETLYILLTLGGTLAAVSARDRWLPWAACGLLFGLAALVRPQGIVIPFFLIPIVWLWDGVDRRGFSMVRAAGICLAASLLVVGPWVIRNSKVFGRPVFISTNGGDNLLIGHHPGATGRYENPDLCGLDRPKTMNEVERDKAASKQALANIQANPVESLKLVPAKIWASMGAGWDAAYWSFHKVRGKASAPGQGADKPLYTGFRRLSQASHWSIWALALVGMVLAAVSLRRGGSFPVAPIALLGFTCLLAAVFFGNPRFGLPMAPFACLYAAHLVRTVQVLMPAKASEKTSA